MRKLLILMFFTLPIGAAAAPHGHGHHHDHDRGGETLHDIMHDLGGQMLALTYGLMTDDPDAVVRSAGAIADHAPISREELERMRGILGDEMAGFEALDEALHAAATRLHEAAKAGQTEAVLTRLNEMQRTCVGCHTQYRERLAEDH